MQNNVFTSVLLPLALATVMLGMGLSLVPEDFKRIARYPKAVAVGTTCQIVLLPLLGVLITRLMPMQPELAIGFIIVAICPGGASSNLITYLAKGDVALSVTLTALSSLITVLTIPLFANLAFQFFLGENTSISLPIVPTILQLLSITLLPTALGMGIRHQFPEQAGRFEKQVSRLSFALLALIIGLLIIKESTKLPGFVGQVGVGVLLLNLTATVAGFMASKLFRLPLRQQLCIAIEVGIQNGTLAIAITAGLLNNPDMAIPAAVYSIWMYLTGCAAILLGRRLTPRSAA